MKKLIYLFVGLLVSLSVAAMVCSRSFNLNDFWDEGNKESLNTGELKGQDIQLFLYDDIKWHCQWVNEDAYVEFAVPNGDVNYQVVLLDVLGIAAETDATYIIEYLKQNNEVIDSTELELQLGKNQVLIPQEELPDTIRIYGKGTVIFGNVWFWEQERLHPDAGFGISFFVIFVLWAAAGIFLKKITVQVHFYEAWCGGLQAVYQRVADIILKRMPLPEGKRRRWARRIVICAFGIINIYINNTQKVTTDVYKWLMVIGVVTSVVLAIISIEGQTYNTNWNSLGAKAWFGLALLVLVSEILIKKQLYGVGLWLLLGLPFLFYVINNMKNPQEFMIDVIRSIELLFVLQLGYCLLFRPFIQEIRYSGITSNPALCGGYAVIAEAALLAEVIIQMRKHSKIKLALVIMGSMANIYLIWITQSMVDLVACMFLILVWLYRIFRMERRNILERFRVVLIVGILGFGAISGLSWGLQNVPYIVGEPVVFPNDVYAETIKNNLGLVEVEASELLDYIAGTRIGDKIKNIMDINELTSGRVEIYGEYLKEINLLGHSDDWVSDAGKKVKAHNALLSMMYRYGVFVVVPYLILLVSAMRNTFLIFCKKRTALAFWNFAIVMAMITVAMADNVEQPYRWLLWYVLYFSIGSNALLNKKKVCAKEEDRERLWIRV